MKQARAEQLVGRAVKTGLRVAVVVPCYNVRQHVVQVVDSIPWYVRWIVLVNDASRDGTANVIDSLTGQRVHAVHLARNSGVGGAFLAGLEKACELGADVIVKMDGDGQMDPSHLPLLIEPLVTGRADYAKGNRFRSRVSLAGMPRTRQIGNAGLSFLIKVVSGYWNILDPTNGYVAIRREVIEVLPVDLVHRRYFFESSMLVALGIAGAVVIDIPMPARYGDETSHLRIGRALIEFSLRLSVSFCRRVWFQKILYSLTIEALLGLIGSLMIAAGTIFGLVEFVSYALLERVAAPPGTVMTAALPILLGFQMVTNAILIDIQSVPKVPLCDRYEPEEPDEAGLTTVSREAVTR